jgi:hemerythrin-like domain-containing protein
MDAIELMVEEHKNIKVMLKVVRKVCFGLLKGTEVDYEEFDKIIDFIKNYADKHHHQKEENYLFDKMVTELGPMGEKLIKNGMLVEHDLGRMFIRNLSIALNQYKQGNEEAMIDIIANAVTYANHLGEHIRKEDNVIYSFARRELKSEVMDRVNEECKKFESETTEESNKYVTLLKELANKYKIEMEEK